MKKLITFSLILFVFINGCSTSKKSSSSSKTPTPPVVEAPVKKEEPTKVLAPPKTDIAPNSLTNAEKAAGWKLLFDGTSTDGWHAYGSRTIGNAWRVANGNLYLDAANKDGWQIKSGGDIVTDEEYSNFELQLDWKIDKGGNSGICIFVNEDKNKYPYMWSTGPEMQILDNNGHSDGKIHKHRAGDLYDLIASKSEPVNPPLEWNHVIIRSLNGQLDFFLNGVNVVSTKMWDDNWNNLIAGSKFKNMPGFGTFKSGRIGLQDHGNNVWFRNIKIRRL
ncbi:MAG TPA: DUF1080 domain-containing protein [Niabella sp.]|jgi:hypothetical protein|nr:DUF1080 domain-containing protein [Chitinophagaceae bacterium]HRO83856.1 DUF1080 domain-containing protein [Niabella sp.]HUN04053.1 DUF1080 domain-containing protein [Niabella sp.]